MLSSLHNKHIVLGITGSIAAYKACTLTRLLIKAGAEVQVVMTPAAKEFITPLTLATLSRNAVASEFFDRRDGSWHSHVDLGLWADAMIIAPASAATLGKMAHGIADNLLITTYLSMKAPVFVAPAMDLDMFAHRTTQDNLARLRSFGHHIIEPQSGELASALVGKGRMEEPEHIVAALEQFFAAGGTSAAASPLPAEDTETRESAASSEISEISTTQKAAAAAVATAAAAQRVLVTAGPTYERIDPVRFIGNFSTGKMGFALAEALAEAGFEVTLVAGPVALATQHPRIHRIDVESAADMYAAALREFPSCHGAILCAAVADFTPKHVATEKIKREATGEWNIPLQPTHDIAQALGATKGDRWLVGFALETHDAIAHARQKMARKHLDAIVLNSLQDEGAGFGHDTNKVTIFHADGSEIDLPLLPKTEVATAIVNDLCKNLVSR